jgi:predicted MPP superfamily phosphohydrolase
MKKRKLFVSWAIVSVLMVAFAVWMIWGNFAVTVSEYTVYSDKLPKAFSGFRICQVSDLHNDELGEENSRLLSEIEATEPDIIVITGDMIDSRRTDVDIALRFAESAIKIAPMYYVAGNHEARMPDEYIALKNGLLKLGVTVIENGSITLERDGETVNLIGVNDESFWSEYEEFDFEYALNILSGGDDAYDILLYHRPDHSELCNDAGIDLVFSGHLHGGQFRLPILGGLYAPSYGLFPKYDGGMYENNESVMIVSRGVGNSIFPIRFNNPREVVLVELIAQN